MVSSAACSVAVLVIEPAKMPSVWPILMPKMWPSPSATSKASADRDKCQEIVFAAGRAGHAFEKLPAVENADAVKEHDQADQADRARDLRLRRKGAEREPDEQHGADAERKSADIDLADEIAEPDREKRCEDRLRPDDVLRAIPACVSSSGSPWCALSGRGSRPRGTVR